MYDVAITYGTFDMFHVGHLKLLKRIKEISGKVIVAISTDEFNLEKGKKAIIPFAQRKEIVESIKYVDLVIPEKSWEQKFEDVKKYNVDLFVMGKDWEGKFDFLKEICEVKYLCRTENVSTSELKKNLSKFLSIEVDDIKQVIDILHSLMKDLE